MTRYYRQCKLARRITDPETKKFTTEHTTTWIPEQFAKANNFIDLWNSEEEVWVKSWKVIEVGSRQSEDYVLGHERDYKTQREASDI